MKKAVFLLLLCLLFTNAYAQWSADRRLSNIQGSSFGPRAACWGDTIHVVWWETYQNPQHHEEVFSKRSLDGGDNWEAETILSVEDSIHGVGPNIAVWQNSVHVTWNEMYASYYAICYKKSTDGGTTWYATDTLRKEGIGGWGAHWIAAKDSNVYVVYIYEDGTLNFTKSTDNGETWSNHQIIGNGGARPRICTFPNIDSSLVVSVNNTIFNREVYCYLSTDVGATWSDSIVISDFDTISSQRPAMATDDSGGIHITWYDYKYSPYPWTGDIFYRASRDSGNSWQNIDSLTVTHRAHACDILAENSNVHVVWQDDRHDFDENFEIYYRMSSDLGQTWEQEVRLTDTLGHSRAPALTCDSQYVHLFWSDNRDDLTNRQGEIYYKRKDLSPSITEAQRPVVISKFKCEVYPNPFSQALEIRFWSYAKDPIMKIFDISGKEVIAYEMKEEIGGLKVDTKNLSCGVYFVQIEAGGERVSKKVVKLR
ncbi:hypothetical protein AMJ74_00010 [candidate division WOR_3 bacterium SM1_77]|uniref:Secretion system C-terminal sorting domain-containing protein n=1 Tax=candidate division WOR_3 bacterium SM1_77 TaxID=1703778 RepID=A0A0S8K426_UNCW3|nr:MAG: hypothetical protein AMJ74_00010 [candidate division WOR_3 bacterium SM1_77]